MTGLTCEEVRELIPLLAINVLDVDERDVVEDHLSGCGACIEELASYSETAAVLALALPQVDPAPELKGRVLAQARRARMVTGGRGLHLPMPPVGHPERASRWQVSLSSLVAGAALLLAASTTIWALGMRAELAEQSTAALALQAQVDEQNARIATLSVRADNYAKVTAVLQAADSQIRVLSGTSDAEQAFGRVYIDPETSEGMLMVRNLPPLPQGKVYQLWVAGADGSRQSAGVLTWTDKSGNGYTLIKCPDTLARWQSFNVTEEPTGGSPLPTGSRLLSGSI